MNGAVSERLMTTVIISLVLMTVGQASMDAVSSPGDFTSIRLELPPGAKTEVPLLASLPRAETL